MIMVYISENRSDLHRYDDIIDTVYPFENEEGNGTGVAVKDRAVQFSPFAALTGFEEKLDTEKERFSSQEG